MPGLSGNSTKNDCFVFGLLPPFRPSLLPVSLRFSLPCVFSFLPSSLPSLLPLVLPSPPVSVPPCVPTPHPLTKGYILLNFLFARGEHQIRRTCCQTLPRLARLLVEGSRWRGVPNHGPNGGITTRTLFRLCCLQGIFWGEEGWS